MSDNNYNHKVVEENLYKTWKEHKLFEPTKKGLKAKNFSIILPPPNVTGKLHLGHAWDGTIQDCLIRHKKMQGYRTAWIPGTDHAGISTQTKFENILREQNIDPRAMPLATFKKDLNEWSLNQANNIRSQWATMGFSLAYSGETFTLDKNVNELVVKTFVELYKKKLIYQDYKLVNWDVRLKTAISDIEVINKQTKSKMYYFKYFFDDNKGGFLPVATTRPETMFGDTNIFVNPKDKRYIKYINRFVINPINGEKIKILADEYVDRKFGTGVMKCTPAHDFNDYELAKKYQIKNYFSVMNYDGTMNEKAKTKSRSYSGIDRLIARKMIIEDLQKNDLVIKIEEHINDIGYSERTNEIVEPLLSKQWFIKMKDITNDIIKIQSSKTKEKCLFYPKRMNTILIRWLENIQDWCISRQLVWGHQIPVWYENKTNKIYVGEESPGKNWTQENSVLDTWFSSGLWPIATTIQNKDKKFADFFPVDVLVTAYDILFFWVARMLFQCKINTKKIPIKNVLIHGLIRDEQNRKMSKSLNNGIDPIDVIDHWGADALRLFLIGSSTLGEDLRFNEQKIRYYWSFLAKLWNVKNLISLYEKPKKTVDVEHEINKWMIQEINRITSKTEDLMNKFDFTVYVKSVTNCFWFKFCDQYLEHAKILAKNQKYGRETIQTITNVYKMFLKIIHPICPFITDYIFNELYNEKTWLVNQKFELLNVKKPKAKDVKNCFEIINAVRRIRIKYGLKKELEIKIYIEKRIILPIWSYEMIKMCNINRTFEKMNNPESINQGASFLIQWESTKSKAEKKEILIKQLAKIDFEIERSTAIVRNQRIPKNIRDVENDKVLENMVTKAEIEKGIKELNSK